MNKLLGLTKSLIKPIVRMEWLPEPIKRRYYFTDFITYQEAAQSGRNTQNLRVLIPAHREMIASPQTDSFVPIGRMYRDGWFDRPDVFVCEVPGAYLHVDKGIVCTREFEVMGDIEPRLQHYKNEGRRKPAAMRQGTVKTRTGVFSTVNGLAAGNYYHWMVDCLPKIYSLARYSPDTEVTLLMPQGLGEVQRESLACILPAHFKVEYHPKDTWFRLETFLLPSLASGFYNGLLPAEYYEAIRRPVFARYGIREGAPQTERIYISRRGARCRRILNEDALVALLKPYGFKTVVLDNMSFRQQVELFHRAEILLGPSGAGFNMMTFCGEIPVVVLHPNQVPDNFFHTMAQGLGQKYHYVLHDREFDDNFEADLPAVQRILEEKLKLRPQAKGAEVKCQQ